MKAILLTLTLLGVTVSSYACTSVENCCTRRSWPNAEEARDGGCATAYAIEDLVHAIQELKGRVK